MPRPLFTPRKDPVHIVQEAGWHPGPVWTGVENLAPHRYSIPGPSSPQPVAIPTIATRPTGYNIECKKMHSRNTIKFLRTNVWKLVFLSLIERLHSTIPSLCNILQLKIHLHVLNSVSVEFLSFLKSQFTMTAQNVHLNQCTCGHTDGHKP